MSYEFVHPTSYKKGKVTVTRGRELFGGCYTSFDEFIADIKNCISYDEIKDNVQYVDVSADAHEIIIDVTYVRDETEKEKEERLKTLREEKQAKKSGVKKKNDEEYNLYLALKEKFEKA